MNSASYVGEPEAGSAAAKPATVKRQLRRWSLWHGIWIACEGHPLKDRKELMPRMSSPGSGSISSNAHRHQEISMLVLEIVARKPLTPAQLMTARVKTQQQSIKRQKADANVMRKREELLKAQQQRVTKG